MSTDVVRASEFAVVTTGAMAQPLGQRREHIRGFIDFMEAKLLAEPQVVLPIHHYVIDGLYVRTMTAPAGVTLTGAVHLHGCLTLLHSGDISILDEDGCARLQGPQCMPTKAGVRRLGYCHTDVVLSTIHSTTKQTIPEIEAELFGFDYLED